MAVFESLDTVVAGNGAKRTICHSIEPQIIESEPEPGMIARIQSPFEGKKDSRGRRPWVTTYPSDLDQPAEGVFAEGQKIALIFHGICAGN